MAKNVITISRKYGSLGRDMGVALSEIYGIEYYDKDLIKIASEETGIHESLFGKADEKINGSFFIKRSGAYKGTVEPPTSADYTSDKNIFSLQAEIIKRLAERESCIIIGRCASYVLKDFRQCLQHIFIRLGRILRRQHRKALCPYNQGSRKTFGTGHKAALPVLQILHRQRMDGRRQL